MFISADNYSIRQWKLVRAMIGAYLALHWYFQLSVYENLYLRNTSNVENLPIFMQQIHKVIFSTTVICNFFIYTFILFALFFLIGFFQKLSAVYLLAAYFFFFMRSPLNIDLHDGFINWLILAYVFVSSSGAVNNWKIPDWLISSGWLVGGVCYTVSGYYKSRHIFWIDGSAVSRMLQIYGGLNWPNKMLIHSEHTKFLTWLILFLEYFFLPSIFFRPIRFIFNLLLIVVHLAIACLTVMWPLSIAVLIFHIFLFDLDYSKRLLKKLLFTRH